MADNSYHTNHTGRYRPNVQHPWQLHDNWAAIERHPRLVFSQFGPEEADMVRYYLATSKPFTVVIR